MQPSREALLQRVYWIGGPPDAGKTTVADLTLRWVFGASVYHQDRHELEHLRRADPDRHPLNAALHQRVDLGPAMLFQPWVDDDPETLMERARATWTERIDMVLDDLAALPADRFIVAEGPGFFPSLLAPLLPDPRRAAFLIPTEAFKRASHARRGKSAWGVHTTDPDRAEVHHIQRDLLFADRYRRELTALGWPWIDVDGASATAFQEHGRYPRWKDPDRTRDAEAVSFLVMARWRIPIMG